MTEIERVEFDFIWDQWIVPTINKVFNQMDPDFREQTNAQIRNLSDLKTRAGSYYYKKRREVKLQFYGVTSSTHMMDFHKLSAILCRTMIEYKVYDFDESVCEKIAKTKDSKDTDWLVHNALANFRLAFYVSIVFLYQSTLFALSKENPKMYILLKRQQRFLLYTDKTDHCPASTSHESFENSIVLDLAKRDVNNRSFDYFMYSAVMYQLEEYNKLSLRHHYQSQAISQRKKVGIVENEILQNIKKRRSTAFTFDITVPIDVAEVSRAEKEIERTKSGKE